MSYCFEIQFTTTPYRLAEFNNTTAKAIDCIIEDQNYRYSRIGKRQSVTATVVCWLYYMAIDNAPSMRALSSNVSIQGPRLVDY
jgi:hypothetical protein